MARVANGEPVDAWTGLVSPTVASLAGLDGVPVSVRTLVDLIKVPGDVAVRQLLRAFPLQRLSPGSGLLQPRHLAGLVEMAARQLVTSTADVDAVTAALIAAVWPELQHDLVRGAFSDDALARAQPRVALLAGQLAERLPMWWQGSSSSSSSSSSADAMVVDPQLPWRLAGSRGRLVDDGDGGLSLVELQRTIRVRSAAAFAPDTAIATIAAAHAHDAVTGMVVVEQGSGKIGRSTLDEARAVLPFLAVATADARRGSFSIARSTILRLSGDRPAPHGAP
jgi:hypothetical protein